MFSLLFAIHQHQHFLFFISSLLAEKEKLWSRATLSVYSSTLIPVSFQRVFDLFCRMIITLLLRFMTTQYYNTYLVHVVGSSVRCKYCKGMWKIRQKHVMTQLHYTSLLWFCLLWRAWPPIPRIQMFRLKTKPSWKLVLKFLVLSARIIRAN